MQPVHAETLESLAAKLGMSPENLAFTVRQYNTSIREGKCLTLSPPKTNFAGPIDTSLFCAYKVTGGFTFAFGGIRTNARAEVIDTIVNLSAVCMRRVKW